MPTNEEQLRVLRDTLDKCGDFYGLAKKWRDEGTGQMDLYILFSEFLETVNDEDSSQRDAILDALDGIYSAWGNRSWFLFETGLSNAEIWAERMRRKGVVGVQNPFINE